MAFSFHAHDPQSIDGSSAASLSFFSSNSSPDQSSAALVIWRLTKEPSSSSSSSSSSDNAITIPAETVTNALDTLFPQLSSSAKAGPSLARITECLSNPETFTLFIATEVTPSSTSSSSGYGFQISRIVGCLTLITLKLLMNSRAHIEDLVVLNDCRGLGLGRALMQRALNEAVQVHHCKMVDLTSKPDRIQARTLYESLGFQLRDTGAFRFYAPV
ncbi:hypothetical protein EMPS_10047 [Entomortierella parvispora]|uniref:N-acetyltransferase domain-containing protein n=1 Tax=Entomortierella parvispora TaxID=205924 RepID=A0A9P3HJR3_9FUNG|nr:hypothetical protein EMPS_10047 [Entomortierella parvispora]